VGITSSTALWYASRASGVVALALLTVVVVFGILVNRRGRLPGLPRFATSALHRNMSLLAVAFLAAHVITAITDPYVTIGIAAVVVPSASAYKAFWIGLGAVSLDIMIALIVTSLARARIGRRTWRAVHWLGYACWPIALVHSIGSSNDMRSGGLLAMAVICAAAVLGAASWRAASAISAPGRAELTARVLADSCNRQPGGPDDAGRVGVEPRLTGAGAR
jgi:predicted ferric reductase